MNSKILIALFLLAYAFGGDISLSWASGDWTVGRGYQSYTEAIKKYQNLSSPKALASAYDNNDDRWVVGYGYQESSAERAKQVAYDICSTKRLEARIDSLCKLYAADDGRIPRTPPASTPPASRAPRPEQEETVSYGTGFAVRSDGYILTSYHIVSGANAIVVSYQDKKLATAILIKHSMTNDLALLKIKDKTPQYLELEESGNVNIGDRVFTIGFPVMKILGTEPKYTEGTISSLAGVRDEASFMQISVPVQPGNSGGPLINERGKVVGVITATAAIAHFLETSGTLPQNVNWAVKSDIARSLYTVPKSSKPKKADRQAIINQARKSVCLVVVSKSD